MERNESPVGVTETVASNDLLTGLAFGVAASCLIFWMAYVMLGDEE